MRRATCRCGQLAADCTGDPVRVSVCHCLDCQKRSGSVFAAQARFPEGAVTITGVARTWRSTGDSGKTTDSGFCPDCGSTVFYRNEGLPGLVAVAIGAFADPAFPAPGFSVWEERRHRWTAVLGADVQHED